MSINNTFARINQIQLSFNRLFKANSLAVNEKLLDKGKEDLSILKSSDKNIKSFQELLLSKNGTKNSLNHLKSGIDISSKKHLPLLNNYEDSITSSFLVKNNLLSKKKDLVILEKEKVKENIGKVIEKEGKKSSNIKEKESYPYQRYIEESSKKYLVPSSLIRAVIKAESNFNSEAISSKGAMGLMQLMPKTAKELQVNDPFSAKENIDGGVKYLRKLLDDYDGNTIKALGAYNAGKQAVNKNDRVPNYKETQNYVKKIINNYMKYNGVKEK